MKSITTRFTSAAVYVRIKVLQEKGKELATVTLPYYRTNFKITDIKGRTIHSDGTVIPLAGKAEDLMVAKTVSKEGDAQQFNKKVFTLPSVEVGSILEYKYEIRYDDNHFSSPEWEVQRSYFIHKESYSFTPFKAFLPGSQNATSMYLIDEHDHPVNTLIWWPILPAGAKINVDITGRHLLELTDVPPIPDEQWMPPIESLIYKVLFYYKGASSAADFWVSEAKYWSKDVDRFAEPSKTFKEAVAGLIAPTDSELDKAKKIYKAVQALDNTDYSRKKSESEMKQLKLRPPSTLKIHGSRRAATVRTSPCSTWPCCAPPG